ncbi:MAG: YceI family protein [Pirellulales bacterium]|nr:YceI family protein [Pirellulales bacterium]
MRTVDRSTHLFCCGILLALGFLSIGQTSAQSMPGQGGPQAARQVRPGEVHVNGSCVYIHVKATGMGHEHAVAGKIREGVIRLGATQDAGYVVFDLASLVADPDFARKVIGLPGTTDASTRDKVTANMLGPHVLDVRRFATATGTIHSAVLLPQKSSRGLPQYQFDGELALHGVTRRMRAVAEAEEQNGWIHLRGACPLVQTEFGMKPYTAALGMVGVADRVEVYGDLWIAADPQVSQGGAAPRR